MPPLLLLVYNSKLFKELIRDLRPLRILHYVILSILGIALSLKLQEKSVAFFIEHKGVDFNLFVISLTYAAVFAIVSNNLEDLESDRITNPNRPLVKGTVNRREYFFSGVVCQVIAFVISALISKELFLTILSISTGYYIYSCKPFRLKRIPFLSKFIIGINSFSVALGGFVLCGSKLIEFPLTWMFFILIPLALSANFIDLKDTEGDRLVGVKTLPVIFGENKAKIIIAISTIITYIMAGFFLKNLWFFPLILITAVLHVWFLFKQPYKEKPVFLIYITGLTALCVLIMLE